jgi:glycosyltransferase involved in cell wall biosynthesis
LADAIVALLNDPARRSALGAAGRHRLETELTVERMARRVADLYREVAGGRADPQLAGSSHDAG